MNLNLKFKSQFHGVSVLDQSIPEICDACYVALASETARASRLEMKRLHQEIREIREEQR